MANVHNPAWVVKSVKPHSDLPWSCYLMMVAYAFLMLLNMLHAQPWLHYGIKISLCKRISSVRQLAGMKRPTLHRNIFTTTRVKSLILPINRYPRPSVSVTRRNSHSFQGDFT